MPRATHWTHEDNPEDWTDNPADTPEEAAARVIENDNDDGWEARNELTSDGRTTITLHGYRETDELLDENRAFDGYEPGQTYFAPTGETIKVKASIAYEVIP